MGSTDDMWMLMQLLIILSTVLWIPMICPFGSSGFLYQKTPGNVLSQIFWKIKLIYFARWAIEGSFRKLKYTIGLSNFHAYKPEYIKQEIWAKLIAYNITETLINHTVVKHGETKHEYKVNFSAAAHICRVFLRLTTEKDPIDVMNLLCKELIPVRNERQYPRLQTAHFRRPRYFIYRAA